MNSIVTIIVCVYACTFYTVYSITHNQPPICPYVHELQAIMIIANNKLYVHQHIKKCNDYSNCCKHHHYYFRHT